MKKETENKIKATMGKGISGLGIAGGHIIKGAAKGADQALKFTAKKSRSLMEYSSEQVKKQSKKSQDENKRTSSKIGHGINTIVAATGVVVGGTTYAVSTSARAVTKPTKGLGASLRDGSRKIKERQKNRGIGSNGL